MKLLFDSDFLIGLFVKSDIHHQIATKTLTSFRQQKAKFYLLNCTIQETATTISHKRNQLEAIIFRQQIDQLGLNQIELSPILESKAWEIFLSQTKKGTSFVDCANLATQEYYHIDHILSFDHFYPAPLRQPL